MSATRAFAVMLVILVQLSYTDADTVGVGRAAPAQGIDSKLADTVRALDTNGNGKVDKSELTVFAKSQGLSSDEVLSEFKDLDVNHDGALDASEIGPLFGETESEVKPKVLDTPAAPAEAAKAPALSAAAVPTASAKPKELKVKVAAEVAASTQLVAGAAEEVQEKDAMGLDLAGLEHDAQEQAGGVLASSLAQRAQVLLARSAVDEHKAKAFDVEVRTLRGNATALSKAASQEAKTAARTATAAVSQKALAKLQKLQAEEQKASAAADDSREAAQKAMVRVRKAQASLRSS